MNETAENAWNALSLFKNITALDSLQTRIMSYSNDEFDDVKRTSPDRVAMPVRILPSIYPSNSRASSSDSFFAKAGIQAVLNVTPNLPNSFCSDERIEYLRVPVYDTHGKRDLNRMYQYLPVITEFMYKTSVMERKNLLVHCALGRQRSCAAIAAYLIKFYKMTPIKAMDFIISKKPDSFHWGKSANFAKSLNRWYYK